MKTLLKTLLPLVLLSTSASADYSAFFRFEDGKRIEYSKNRPQGEIEDETMKKEALLHVSVPQGSEKAMFSLTYGGGDKGLDQSWQGQVVYRGEEMIVITFLHPNPAGKMSQYVLYPAHGAGFLISYSAYLGNDFFKKLAETDGSIPFGTASILRLIEYKK